MKKVNLILASLILFGLMTGCNGGASQITMTLKAEGNVMFAVGGNGTATIDWGDGSPVKTVTLNPDAEQYEHHYAQSAEYTVQITGEGITLFKGCEIGITTLDVSRSSTLNALICYSNQLKSLDVSKNAALTALSCADNQLTALDVSKNAALEELYCSVNQLKSLDVSKNAALRRLQCGENLLMTLDVSANTRMESLWCIGNSLTTLDVSKNTALTELFCFENQLTSLDMSKNSLLERIDCNHNQLTSLILKDNDQLYYLTCTDNQLSTKTLNALFQSLNNVSDEKAIYMIGNPGADDCDRSIAEKKAWRVEVYMDDDEW